MTSDLESRLAARIERDGPLPFREYLEAALYDEDAGFYSSAGQAGRRGADFVTAPEVGPLFGVLVARRLDRVWDALDQPDHITLVDAGSGPGTLLRSVRAARPRCLPALRLVGVERSARQRQLHPEGVESVADLPEGLGVGLIVANELLDNLPFDLYEKTAAAWSERRIGISADRRLAWTNAPVDGTVEAELDALVPSASPGSVIPLQREAAAWVERARASLDAGVVVSIDYCSTTRALAGRPLGEWLRTYRQHGRGDDPLAEPGSQDVTSEVAVDQLPPSEVTATQAEWLTDLGIEALVAEGRQIWSERAQLGDLVAMKARSRIGEAEALLDPAGLGAFTVLEWSAAGPGRALS